MAAVIVHGDYGAQEKEICGIELHFHNCLVWIYIINIVYMFLPPNFHIVL